MSFRQAIFSAFLFTRPLPPAQPHSGSLLRQKLLLDRKTGSKAVGRPVVLLFISLPDSSDQATHSRRGSSQRPRGNSAIKLSAKRV
jgi:hypothetical protein